MRGRAPVGSPQPVSDEEQLRDIEQSLVLAWLPKDRAYIENVLAWEWTVAQADGTQLTRATVLGPFFDSVQLESNVIDDVSVMLYGTTAVVRGRTVASGTLNGSPVSARIRFTDVFTRRDGRWQAVASHTSPLAPESSANVFNRVLHYGATSFNEMGTEAASASVSVWP